MGDAGETLGDLLTRVAALGADRPAITLDDRTLTFGALDDRATRVAHALVAAGLGPGDRMAVLLRNRPEFFELLFGAARAGVVLVALNWRLAAGELAAILADAAPALLVTSPSERDLVAAEPGCDVVLVDDEVLTTPSQARPTHVPSPDDVVLQLYSSGTTGQPKGARLTHANLAYTPRMGREFYGMGPESVNLVPSPLFHIGASATGSPPSGRAGTPCCSRTSPRLTCSSRSSATASPTPSRYRR